MWADCNRKFNWKKKYFPSKGEGSFHIIAKSLSMWNMNHFTNMDEKLNVKMKIYDLFTSSWVNSLISKNISPNKNTDYYNCDKVWVNFKLEFN